MPETDKIIAIAQESIDAKNKFFTKTNAELINEACKKIVTSFENGGKLLLCGNGGSASDCQHIAAEFVNRFKIERTPLPALSLTTDTSNITSIANDYSFDEIFSKQVKALGMANDILIGISTSGNSKNVIEAVKVAKKSDIFTISLTGKDGGELSKISDLNINVNNEDTARIQEVHILIGHIICETVDNILFAGASEG